MSGSASIRSACACMEQQMSDVRERIDAFRECMHGATGAAAEGASQRSVRHDDPSPRVEASPLHLLVPTRVPWRRYLAFGSSMDYMYEELHVQYPLTIEVGLLSELFGWACGQMAQSCLQGFTQAGAFWHSSNGTVTMKHALRLQACGWQSRAVGFNGKL